MSRYSSKNTSSLLKDNSWIKKADDEDEDVDRDPNFGKSLLSRHRSNEPVAGSEAEEKNPIKPISTSSSVSALTKRFSGSQDELRSSKTTSTYTKSTYPSLKSDSPKTTTTSKTTVTEEPKTGTTTTTITKDGKTTTETTTTTTQSVRSPVLKSPTKTFTEQVKSSSKGLHTTYSPTRTTKVTETTVTSDKDAEDKLFDTLIPSSVRDEYSPIDSKTITTTETVPVKSSPDTRAADQLYKELIPSSVKEDLSPRDSKTRVTSTETVTVKSSGDEDGIKTTTTTKTSSTAEDDLYDTLLPKSITSKLPSSVRVESPTLSSPSSTRRTTSYSSYTDDIPTTRTTSYTISSSSDDYNNDRSYSYSRPDSSYEYSSVTSPSVYTSPSYRSSSRSDDSLADPIYSKSSKTSVYAPPERIVHEKDLCTICHKPFTGDAKMVLDDLINCHASCFKCQVCNSTLSNMKAGDCMWIYKRMVHCENCFEVTRDKWRR
ncbi:sciellin isoform X3 [Enoplosus armatus]|uniref:sciellin isoform X3 n=1 Tax=Enoplosus armatus TaxID=215367 RepID=UPI0039935842